MIIATDEDVDNKKWLHLKIIILLGQRLRIYMVFFLAIFSWTYGDYASAVVPTTVTGTLTMLVPDITNGIDMPDIKLELINSKSAVVATGVTYVDGSFRLTANQPGSYSLCWNIQGVHGCNEAINFIAGENKSQRVEVKLDGMFTYGQVLTADKRPCWINDPFFNLNVSTQIDISNDKQQSVAKPVRANSKGYYLFVLKQNGIYTVRASCEKAAVSASTIVGKSSLATNLTLPNHAPRIVSLMATSKGKSVLGAAPGTKLTLIANARDKEDDQLQYLWRDNDGKPLVISDTPTITRIAAAGRNTSYLMVRDGKGGYAYKTITPENRKGTLNIQFSGFVLDETTRKPIVKAKVEFAGRTISTNVQGWFSVSGSKNAANRYVLNIRHPNYATLSNVFDRSETGVTFDMIVAQITTIKSSEVAINVIDKNSSGLCGKTPTQKNPPIPRRAPTLKTVEYADNDNPPVKPLSTDFIKQLTATQTCQKLGAQIRIPANGLERLDKKIPVGRIRMAMATLDPTRRALPGDNRAIDKQGKRANLVSYGAVFVEFRDSTGALLNLRPKVKAEIRVPVPSKQQSTMPPKVITWSYQEDIGLWNELGLSELLTQANAIPVFTTSTTSVVPSIINIDVPNYPSGDPKTCVRFEVTSSLAAWSNLHLLATVSHNGNQVVTRDLYLTGGPGYYLVEGIPFGNTFPPNTLRVQLFGNLTGGSQVVLLDNIINTDARPQASNAFPENSTTGYSECGNPIVLDASSNIPAYATEVTTAVDGTGVRPLFLTGTGSFAPLDGEAIATAYYSSIDPNDEKLTLGAWLQLNHFNDPQHLNVNATYLNYNDLGFGRNMTCRANGLGMNGKVACYVTNYGAPDQNPQNADDATSQTLSKRGATVAMEYDPNATSGEEVQFYVYNDTGSVRLNFADLDGFGPKPVPHLCMVCHGGDPLLTNQGSTTSTQGKVQYARFREFDLPSFKYSLGRSWDYGNPVGLPALANGTPDPNSPYLNTKELDTFGQLNAMVTATAPVSSPIKLLIDSWYPAGGITFPWPGPISGAVPVGWAANVTDYNEIYGKSCRTCHVARDAGVINNTITFNTYTDFTNSGVSGKVCSPGNNTMPNAAVTYKNFWLNVQPTTSLTVGQSFINFFNGLSPGSCVP